MFIKLFSCEFMNLLYKTHTQPIRFSGGGVLLSGAILRAISSAGSVSGCVCGGLEYCTT